MIEQVLQEVDILEVVEQYTELQKTTSGEYKGRCPFPHHEDNNPSFTVNPDKNLFNCFGCNTSGNTIQFVEKVEGIDFKTALNKLADNKGIEPTKIKNNYRNSTQDFINTIQELKDISRREEVFGGHLIPKYTKHQHKYFTEQFKKTTLERFDIGYCFDPSDELHNRVVIPWRDEEGRLLALVGRDVTGNSKAKYKAKKGSRKQDTLFNLYQAKRYADNCIVVVEDEKSVMRLWELGIKNAVALGCTSINGRKFLLRKYTDTIVLALDNDKEGKRATKKIRNKLNMMFKVHTANWNNENYKDLADVKDKEKCKNILFDNLQS